MSEEANLATLLSPTPAPPYSIHERSIFGLGTIFSVEASSLLLGPAMKNNHFESDVNERIAPGRHSLLESIWPGREEWRMGEDADAEGQSID